MGFSSGQVIFAAGAAVQQVAAKVQIEAMKHDIRMIRHQEFNKHIGSQRDGRTHALWFFKDTTEDENYLDTLNGVASELKGIVDFHAVDCDVAGSFCSEHKVESTPAVMLFPPQSFMPGTLVSQKVLDDREKLAKKVKKLVPSNVEVLDDKNIVDFMTKDVSKPKFVLFSEQENPAFIWKAISSDIVMQRTCKFGFTNSPALKEKYSKAIGKSKGKAVLVSFRGDGGKQQEKYKGKLEFHEMKAWVNNFVESGMGDKIAGAGGAEEPVPLEEAKPWLVQDIPELTGPSHKDVCFKGEGLCVMYLLDGKLGGDDEKMLKGLQSSYTSQLSGRGTVFKWMWMDMSVESEFKELFNPDALPAVVVFNPHKRLRFTKPDTEDAITESGINGLIEKILAGDARFKVVPGQKLPKWASRKADDKKEEKSEL